MIENEMEGKDENVGEDIEARRARFENERMTRRGALRKFGFMAGMAVFATLSVDDLARIAAKKLQDAEATKGIGDMLAKEFRSSGVALADEEGWGAPDNTYNPFGNPFVNLDAKCGKSPSGVDCKGRCHATKELCDSWCDENHSGPMATACKGSCLTSRSNCNNWCTTHCLYG